MRFFVSLIFLSLSSQLWGDFAREIQPFLKTHCLKCHGEGKQKGGVRFDKLSAYHAGDQQLWTKVFEQLHGGEMPPKERPQPKDAEKNRVLAWITEKQRLHTPTTTRRLNRRELSGALQDLTGLKVDFAAGLPGDGTVNGFDTGADALQDAGDSIAQAMEISRRAVSALRFLDPAPTKSLVINLDEELYQRDLRKAFSALKEFGYESRGKDAVGVAGEGIYVRARSVGDRDKFSIDAPVSPEGRGVLRLRFSVASWKPMEGLPNPHLWVQVGGKTLDHLEITNPVESPVSYTYDVQLEDVITQKGEVEIALRVVVEMPYGVKGFPNDEKAKPEDRIPGGTTGLYRPKYDRKKVSWDKAPIPYVVFDQIEINPNYVATWPPLDWTDKPVEITDHDHSAEQLLALWIERAWRRPVSTKERQPMFEFYQRLRKDGLTFDAALRATFQSVLMSGPFRFLPATSDPDEVIAQHAIASRLSFMLVAAPPDRELRELAAKNKLRDPKVLQGQIDRLLEDPRSEKFWEPFITQWLVLEQPITLAMDHIKKQDFRFGRFLKASMRDQTHAYIRQLVMDNRPARDLVQSDWTMMNNSLARFYDYKDVAGAHMRKVSLRKDDPRGGGLLGHAGIQSMLCWMGDHWVIYRGAWALRHILDDPPPPPPLEVPELDAAEHGKKSMRELLQIHQEQENCAVCHRTMDPLGFAFQNFDLSGRWRDVEHEKYYRYELDGKIEWRGQGKTRPTDAVGKLPRGEEFKSFAEFKAVTVKHYQADMVRGILKNFSLYATGRQPSVDDLQTIHRIMQNRAKASYPLRDLLNDLLQSEVFLGRR